MALYEINEIFDSIQGEGIDTGKRCTFIRFAGCNMKCSFCDTYFKKTVDMEVGEILLKVTNKNVVLTGGEPLIHDLMPLIRALWIQGKTVTIETNGTLVPPEGCFISLSPKVSFLSCKVKAATSLKILYPWFITADGEITPHSFIDFPTKYRSIQVIDPERNPKRIKDVIDMLDILPPEWRLGIQLHKFIGVK